MGISLVCLAIKDIAKETVWDKLSLRRAEVQDESACSRINGPIMGVQASNGWYYIIDYSWKILEDQVCLAELSREVAVFIGAVEEHVNYSMAACWISGSKLWLVEHQLEKGVEHLSVQGIPPAPFEEIRSRIIRKRNETPKGERCDFFFSIPEKLHEALTEYSDLLWIRGIIDPQSVEILTKDG